MHGQRRSWSPSVGLFGRFFSGKLHRRTAFVEDTARFRKALRGFLGNAAAVVACCEWSIPVLERNGASRDRIVHCPQGVPMDSVKAVSEGGLPAEASAKATGQLVRRSLGEGGRSEEGGVAELLGLQVARGEESTTEVRGSRSEKPCTNERRPPSTDLRPPISSGTPTPQRPKGYSPSATSGA